MDGDPGEKRRGRGQVAQIVQPGMGEWCGRGSGRPVVLISLVMSALAVSG